MSAMKPGGPFADTRLVKYLNAQIDALKSVKSQREIATEIGYDKPNMISMFKRGDAKVPLEKIPALARALNVDPAFLFRLAMQQYWPADDKAIAAIFGTVTTKNEAKILDFIRLQTDNTDPDLTPELQEKLRTLFG